MPLKDPEKRKEYARHWMKNRRDSFFSGKTCVICGRTDSLELDHINPETKVSHRIWSWSEPRRLKELAKCQVLCSLCHQEKTIRQQPITNGWTPYQHGSSLYRKGCRCQICKDAEALRARRYRKKKREES